ncbi:RNA polymerase sigma factor [Engelhardtia mirabilis]|uniref:RNA polymerase sigma factor CnrH n=1 Tax=Engelhardtia mirabilis TaxID=2528011 RepID=A0A518BSE7_9BACT|nr:RNA polymerase sigma factor CnrH [Planctomycetes bacterium Pla133]QDV04214.1 RNA polymerase sigma factor CnrH [Planctomycetes bacterium Pla86]
MGTDPLDPRAARDARTQVDLVREAQADRGDALAQLVERHYAAVLAMVRRRLGPQLRRFHESGDVVQEALVQAVRTFDRYDLEDEDAFLRWISTVVENRIRDLAKFHQAQRRGSGAERRLGSIDVGGAIQPAQDSAAGPATRAELDDRDERVRAALERLDERSRRLVEARTEGRAWTAIAGDLGYPSDAAARMAYSRALIALTRNLPS